MHQNAFATDLVLSIYECTQLISACIGQYKFQSFSNIESSDFCIGNLLL